MREFHVVLRHASPGVIVLADSPCSRGLLVVIGAALCDGVDNLLDSPDDRAAVFVFRDSRALVQIAVLVFEEAILTRLKLAVPEHLIAAGGGGCSRVFRCRIGSFCYRTVTIYAIDFYRVADLAIELAVAVIVLLEMTIYAVHSFLEVNVLQVNRQPFVRRIIGDAFGSAFELVRVDISDDVVVRIEEVTFPIVFKHVAIDPSVSVEVGELSVLELRVDLVADRPEKVYAAPLASKRRFFRIARQNLLLFLRSRFLESFFAELRIHFLGVGFKVPPRRAVVAHQNKRARMHVTNNTLTRRNRSSELMPDRMPRLFVIAHLSQCNVAGLRCAVVTELRIRPRMKLIAVVGIDHVTRRAAARTIVPRLIVSTKHREHRIKQTCFL